MAPPLHEVLTDHPGVVIMAYVDDIVILGPPELVRLAYLDLVENECVLFPPVHGRCRWQSSRRRGPWGAHGL